MNKQYNPKKISTLESGKKLHPDALNFSPLAKTNHITVADTNLPDEDYSRLKQVGIDMKNHPETGKFLLYDNDEYIIPPKIEGVEIIPLSEAIELEPNIKEKYWFKAVDKHQDKFTQQASRQDVPGYFIRVKRNVQLKLPLHAGLFMHTNQRSMCVHNIVVVEDGAHLHLITGCTAGCNTKKGLHIAVSEHYIGKNAKFINTMIHNWGPEFIVRPRSGTIVDDDATFVSNYYSVNPPKSIETTPVATLRGKNSSAKYMTVLASMPGTYCDIGGTVIMSGENSSAELVARAVNHGGTVVQTGLLTGAAEGTRGHVDCSGLMLNENGIIEAVPGLRSVHPDARMSHEAAIGKIDMGEVSYLQSKGLEEMQAIALIIRGFLDIGIEIEGLDKSLEEMIQQISELSGHGE